MTTATLTKWGNSQGIVIPKDLCRKIGIAVGDQLSISVNQDGSLRVTPAKPTYRRRRNLTIEELFDGYDGAYQPQEMDWGHPVGEEAW